MNTLPIGVVDTGVGGLSVWQEVTKLLPQESTIYLADSKNCPYGDKSVEEITSLSRRLIKFLLRKKVKLIVIACNTITVSSLDALRSEFKNTPIIGTVPIVKKAVEQTKKKKIGILSTNRTAQSHYQKHLIEQFADGVEVLNVGTNKLVPLVEKGEIEGERVKKILDVELQKFKEAEVDLLALGCTHFPFLKKEMGKILGQTVTILDSGAAIARQVKRVLEKNGDLASKKVGEHILYTTGNKEEFEEVVGKLLGVIPAKAGIQICVKSE